MAQSVYLEHAAREAGYFLPDEEAEHGIRDLVDDYSDNVGEGRNQVRLAIKSVTGGAVFSEEEITVFIEGYSVRDILALRIADLGDIRRPHGCLAKSEAAKPKPMGEFPTRDEGGRETAFCLSCDQMRPITFGYSERVTGGVILNGGGPVNLMRTMHETEAQTFCAVCGHRVFTDAEAKRLEQEEADEKAKWAVVWVFAGIAAVIIVSMIASAPN